MQLTIDDIVQANQRLVAEFDSRSKSYGLNQKARDYQLIASITTTPDRIEACAYVADLILRQTLKADKVILWLGDESFSQRELPGAFENLRDRGLEIEYVPDIGPHTKYYYAMQRYPDDLVCVFDDDVIYSLETLANLVASWQSFPHAVSAMLAHRILTTDGGLLPYDQWEQRTEITGEPRFDLFVTNVGGALYPPRLLPDETLNAEKIRELCLFADDVWLKAMELMAEIPVVVTQESLSQLFPPVGGTQDSALFHVNVGDSRNDQYLGAVFDFYHLRNEYVLEMIQRGVYETDKPVS